VRRFLYDTSVFVYALGRDDPYKEPCREIVRRAATGELQGEASVDLLQEARTPAISSHWRPGRRSQGCT
jgi:predicted nucleic acid-binding protein